MSETSPNQSSVVAELDGLLAAMLDEQGLSDAQWHRLREILASDPAARARYRRQVRIHALLEAELSWPLEAVTPAGAGDRPGSAARRQRPRHHDDEPQLAEDDGRTRRSLNESIAMPAIREEDVPADEEPAAPAPPSLPFPAASEAQPWYRQRRWLVAASILLVAAIAAPFAFRRPAGPGRIVIAPPATEPAAPLPVVATLTEQTGAEWDGSNAPIAGGAVGSAGGARLTTGVRRLTRGTAQLTFDGGARVTLQAPARVDLTSPGSMVLLEGTLAATVPPKAHGFVVSTPRARVVDLGTEFGMHVNNAGRTDVHVLEGRVTLAPATANAAAPATTQPTMVQAGSARRVDERQHAVEIPLEPRAFEFAARADAPSPYSRWMAHGQTLRRDKTLLAYFTFERNAAEPASLVNGASGAGVGNGLIENAEWAAGRFPGKTGLHFKGTDNRVKVNVPGRLTKMTTWAWVRVDALDRNFTTLFASDEWQRKGALHWNLIGTGQMEFGTRNPATTTWRWRGPERVVDPSPRWLFLAAVYQTGGGVRFYVDGEPTGPTVKQEFDDPGFNIDAAQIGNWANNPRTFKGTIDEFGILGRAMTDGEVKQLYESSKP